MLPENDILRFFIVLIGMLLLFTILFKFADSWVEIKKFKYRDEKLFGEMKEALNDDEDDSSRG